jgi:hypothetical protein
MGRRLSLGEFLDVLERQPEADLVLFDFGGMVPTRVNSYRGYYEDLAIGFGDVDTPKVAEVLKELRSAIGKTFEGYKGGNYRMGRNSRLWVANYGRTSDTVITGIAECSWATVIATRWEE